MKVRITADYARLRRRAYPPLQDAIEALVARESGDPQPWRDYVAAVQAVKARFPKPPTPPGPPVPPGPPSKARRSPRTTKRT